MAEQAGEELPVAAVMGSCKGCRRATRSVPCARCGALTACANCGRCPPCDGPVNTMTDQCCPMDTYAPGPDGEEHVACTCPEFCECMCLSCACTDWGEEYDDFG